ncbi:hypothetical protein PybrP1_010721 [[Pythium] brassicae (nom. inval.)]|nr:hypothetical protein PybrP1_010721 [[Pythium] brassicae (nom. inval.)]
MTLPRRVLCSLAELRAQRGRALKFELVVGGANERRRRETGLVFWCEASERPRAFVNRCPHARLELDLDDSDFFSTGFLQCKAHGAFFDPHGSEQARSAYRREKQRELAVALASRAGDVQEMQAALQEKAVARTRRYREQQQQRAAAEAAAGSKDRARKTDG